MRIRTRLVYSFLTVTITLLVCFSVIVYAFSSYYRANEYKERLHEQASLIFSVFENQFNKATLEQGALTDTIAKEINLVSPSFVILNNKGEIQYLLGNKEELAALRVKNPRFSIDEPFQYFKVGQREEVTFFEKMGNQEYLISISAVDKYGFSKLNFLGLILSIATILSAFIAIAVGNWFAYQTTQPISAFIDQVKKITFFDLKHRLPLSTSKDEINYLGRTFNQMLDRLEEAASLNKNFVQNASHELRTPLTAIRGQIEVALLQDQNKDQLSDTLNSILDDINRLTRLTNDLLGLSQLSKEQVEKYFHPVRIDELLWDARSSLLKAKPDFNVEIEFGELENENLLEVTGHEGWLKNAFLNLMENGCKFSPNHKSTVTVSVKNALKLSFKDNGIGIPLEDQAEIFKPFYRAKNATKVSGSGIGLSLTKRIIDLHNAELSLVSEENKGTTFTIIFSNNTNPIEV